MKISKEEKLLESVQLTEEEQTPAEIKEEEKAIEDALAAGAGNGIDNVEDASTEEIKQEIIASSAQVGLGVDPQAAEEYAKGIQAVADALNTKAADYAAVNAADDNSVISKLNACLKSGLKRWVTAKADPVNGWKQARSIRTDNLLVIGMPGFGKTAAVYDWCDAMGITPLTLTVSTMSREIIAGIPWPTEEDKGGRIKAKNVESDTWDVLFDPDKGQKVVVFLDEINTSKPDVEAALLTFVAERKLPIVSKGPDGKKVNQTVFDNILFFVGAMNPTDSVLFGKTIHKLNNALDSRFNLRHRQKGSRKEFLTVMKGLYNSILANKYLSPEDRYEYEGQFRIIEALMKDKNFHFWDREETRAAHDDAIMNGITEDPHSVNYRELAQLVYGSDGTKADFLKRVKWGEYTLGAYQMFETALASYVDKPKLSNSVFGGQQIDPTIQNAAAEEIDDIFQSVMNDFNK